MTHFARNQVPLYEFNDRKFPKKKAASPRQFSQLAPAMHLISRFTLLFLALIALANCKGQRPVDKFTEEKILIFANSAEPANLDPQVATGVLESNIISSLFEGLCVQHPSDESIDLPGVAERWEHTPDFRTWTFHLRKNAKWSNGSELTTADFLFSYERMLTPDFGAKYASMLYFINNAEQFNKGEIKDFSQVGVKAIDKHTLVIELKASVPFLPDLTKHYTWYPVPKEAILAVGTMTQKGTNWTDPDNIISNGPFKMKAWRFNDYIEVQRNHQYWDDEVVKLNGIRFLPISNAYTEARMFFDGQLHVTYTLAPEMIQYAKAKYPKFIRQEPYLGSNFIRCNIQRKGLDNPKVRRALAISLDNQSIIDNILQGGQAVATGLTPPLVGYNPPKVVKYDAAEAKRLLKEAGYDENNKLRLKLLSTDKDVSKRLSEAFQAMWKQELGVEVSIEQYEWKTYLDRLQKSDYDLAIGGWIADYPDPTSFLDLWKDGDGNNRTNWSSKQYEALLKKSENTNSAEERYLILAEAEQILLDEMPIIPVHWYTSNYLLDTSVKGWNPLILNNQPYKFIDLIAE